MTKLTPDQKLAAAHKIAKLRREGVERDQAVATGMNMAKRGKLTPSGDYVRMPKKGDY